MRKRSCGKLITQNRLLLKVRERYRNEFAEDVVGKCKAAKLLVLDECGFMTGARDELPAIYEILDYRHGEMLPTVLTTNVTVAQFDEAFGDRIADRLRCHQPFVVLSGNSWRGTK
jgi:DNA replication protein DnaC